MLEAEKQTAYQRLIDCHTPKKKMVSFSCCSIDIEDDRLPLHAHADCVNIIISPHTSIHNRRKMMRQRGTIKKNITRSALLLIVQLLICGCRASSDHDEAVDLQLQRRLQVVDTWLPDQGGLRCTNDQEQERWMPTHNSIPACCKSHFGWDEQSCLKNTAEWLAAATDPFFSELQPQEKFYPDTSAGICRLDSPERPEWMSILVSSYSQCCQEHIPWDVETCMKGNVPVNDDLSDSTQLYYPDTSAGICKPDSPERPEWMNILVPGYRKCCEDHLAWDFEKCMNNEPVIEDEPEPQSNPIYFNVVGPTTPPPTLSPTVDPYSGFYADVSLRKCLPNSPNKPAWNEDVAPTHLECCKTYLDWAFKDCVADIPPTFRPTSYPIAAKDMPDPTTSPTESPHGSGFYAEDVTRSCLPNSADRPIWNTNIAPTQLECCQRYFDWAFAQCVSNIPPTLRPTRTPTIAPSAKPTEAPVTAEVSLSIGSIHCSC